MIDQNGIHDLDYKNSPSIQYSLLFSQIHIQRVVHEIVVIGKFTKDIEM